MKLESLESKKISNLNLIVGGVNSITDGTNTYSLDPKSASCSGGCTVVVHANGNTEQTGGTWRYDY